MESKTHWKAYSTLCGGTVYMLFVGSMYITGNLQTYVESYFQVSTNTASIILPTIYVMNSIGVASTGKIIQSNAEPKVMILIGATLSLSLLAIATSMKSFWGFWFFYTSTWGTILGLTYLICFHHLWQWFPNHRGLASGIPMFGFGMGASVMDPITTALINPNNENFRTQCYPGATYGCYPSDVNANFKKTMFDLIFIFASIAIIGILTIFKGPGKIKPKSEV